eukprot:TRINITY_DN4591_c0_g1_i1.p1 TRINITY_DN4591_c0_g1~~TRINITY_DN4591_c0_g1_i1.p1  ORF type:complete len:199 (-),score=37.76 TRINITY_DN4591_c0_g1_i1:565-1161(-)
MNVWNQYGHDSHFSGRTMWKGTNAPWNVTYPNCTLSTGIKDLTINADGYLFVLMDCSQGLEFTAIDANTGKLIGSYSSPTEIINYSIQPVHTANSKIISATRNYIIGLQDRWSFNTNSEAVNNIAVLSDEIIAFTTEAETKAVKYGASSLLWSTVSAIQFTIDDNGKVYIVTGDKIMSIDPTSGNPLTTWTYPGNFKH